MSPESCRPEAWRAAGPPGSLPKAKKPGSGISSTLLECGRLLGTDVQRVGPATQEDLRERRLGSADVEIEVRVGK